MPVTYLGPPRAVGIGRNFQRPVSLAAAAAELSMPDIDRADHGRQKAAECRDTARRAHEVIERGITGTAQTDVVQGSVQANIVEQSVT